jgi:hypothetical protein
MSQQDTHTNDEMHQLAVRAIGQSNRSYGQTDRMFFFLNHPNYFDVNFIISYRWEVTNWKRQKAALDGWPAKRAGVARRDHNCGATHGALDEQHLI